MKTVPFTARCATAAACLFLLAVAPAAAQTGNSYQAQPAAGATAKPSALAVPAKPVQPTAVRKTHHQTRKVVVRKRKLSHSLAIIGGSAGWGAAIGAIAGGGPGAAIGALIAGGGGFVYDHFTRKKRVVVE